MYAFSSAVLESIDGYENMAYCGGESVHAGGEFSCRSAAAGSRAAAQPGAGDLIIGRLLEHAAKLATARVLDPETASH
jgi:hypothetical protein